MANVEHPIRLIRAVVEVVLADLDGAFDEMYAVTGRPSVPPEVLLKATILMAMYSIRSERAFCERLNYDLLFKLFLDLRIDDRAFDASTFSKNRQRLLGHDIADEVFAAVVGQAKLRRYISIDHFTVDGTLLEAWASHKASSPAINHHRLAITSTLTAQGERLVGSGRQAAETSVNSICCNETQRHRRNGVVQDFEQARSGSASPRSFSADVAVRVIDEASS